MEVTSWHEAARAAAHVIASNLGIDPLHINVRISPYYILLTPELVPFQQSVLLWSPHALLLTFRIYPLTLHTQPFLQLANVLILQY